MIRFRTLVLTASLGMAAHSADAGGVPVVDGANLAKNIEQVSQALADAERQIAQIQEMKAQLQKMLDIEGLLGQVLGSVEGLNDIRDLYNSVEDIRARAQKIKDLGDFSIKLSLGKFDDLEDLLLDDDVTVGEKHAVEAVRESMATAGFTPERLEALNAEDNARGKVIAQSAATNATAMAAAQMSYDEAAASIERVNGLVNAIGDQNTLKESVDLNTRMAAETNFMLGQMWRLNASEGLATGQQGINLAAEQAKAAKFFDYTAPGD